MPIESEEMLDVQEYDFCPLEALRYDRNIDVGGRRLGLEVEMFGWSRREQRKTFDTWDWLQGLLREKDRDFALGYCMAGHDGSLESDSGCPAELKTPPLTRYHHGMFHWATNERAHGLAGEIDVPRSLKDVSWKVYNAQTRWFPNGGAYSNRTCGIHVTLAKEDASELTWAKTLAWLNGPSVNHRELFLRQPNGYCRAATNGKLTDFRKASRDWDAYPQPPGVDKYSTLRVKWGELCEFRGFRSTLKPRAIMRCLDVAEAILDFMQDTPMHRVPVTSTEDFGAWVAQNREGYPSLARWLQTHGSDSYSITKGFKQQR